jgi:2Fe-2S ferredoxin
MTAIVLLAEDGSETILQATSGFSLMEIIKQSGTTELLAICGGLCSCGTCHVYIDGPSVASLKTITSDEDYLLSSSNHRQAESRLACEIIFNEGLDGMRVRIAPQD